MVYNLVNDELFEVKFCKKRQSDEQTYKHAIDQTDTPASISSNLIERHPANNSTCNQSGLEHLEPTYIHIHMNSRAHTRTYIKTHT